MPNKQALELQKTLPLQLMPLFCLIITASTRSERKGLPVSRPLS